MIAIPEWAGECEETEIVLLWCPTRQRQAFAFYDPKDKTECPSCGQMAEDDDPADPRHERHPTSFRGLTMKPRS